MPTQSSPMMMTDPGDVPPSLKLSMPQTQAPDPSAPRARDLAIAESQASMPAPAATSSPLPSTPTTPALRTPSASRMSQRATSPLAPPQSPRPSPSLRRTSSATSLNSRLPSSPKLVKKGSRASLGTQPTEPEKRPTPKRSISNLIAGLREAQTTMDVIEEPIPLTATQIAMEHFTRELMAHKLPGATTETVVILHDACYGHRYSRLKTNKTTLSMIVERPERLHASVLGASTAYVRLGAHHAGARNAPHPERVDAAPPPFKIRRTGRSMDITSSYVTNVHGTAWMSELRTMCDHAGDRIAAGEKELSRSSAPTDPDKRQLHEGDLYLAPESLNAFQGALGGVADAVDAIFTPTSPTKRAFVAVRPPGHHCSADYPSGFCWLNNVHVGIEYAAQLYGLTHAAILDFDLHHGDGSQSITWERNSKNYLKRLNAKPNSKLKLGPDIGYYSLHDINSYPCEMGDDEKVQAASLCIENAHGQNIWNVHLQPWKTEDEFWKLYETRYRVLVDKARAFLRYHTVRLKGEGKVPPKAAIFISAGFDASEWEGAGMQRHKVNVPTEFYARFTRDMVQLSSEAGSGCDGRVISVLEGGYSDRALCSGVLSHLSGLCATPIDASNGHQPGAEELEQLMNGLAINGTASSTNLCYDKTWWSAANLTALELKVNPPPPPGPGKKVRAGPQPTYATPTESFAYKVVDANKFARSISGTMREAARPARPPTPPAPEVDWVVATQELSRLLIPADRQTKSCTPEELAGVRAKKDRQSAVAILTTEESSKPRQLRDRRAKAPARAESTQSDELESVRSVSRNSSRRQTIAILPSSDPVEPSQPRRASRRLSAGSTLSSMAGDLEPTAPPVPALPARANAAMQPPAVPGAGVQVKKTRAPLKATKKAASSASAPVSPANPNTTTALPPPSEPASSTAVPASHGMDALTNGMRKVTLKVGTREEHDRKQKERVDMERRARALKAAETRKANAAAKKAAKEGGMPTFVADTKAAVQQAKENAPPPSLKTEAEPANHEGARPATQAFAAPEVQVKPEMVHPIAEPSVSTMGIPSHAPSFPAPGTTIPYQGVWTHPAPEEHQMSAESVLSTTQPQAFHGEPPSANQMQWASTPVNEQYGPTTNFNMTAPATGPPDGAVRQLTYESEAANAPALQQRPFPSSSPARSPPGQKLPVWTSTGSIPFAAPDTGFPTGGAPHLPSHQPLQASMQNGWSTEYDVPPPQYPGDVSATRTSREEPPAPNGRPQANIWDVPATPQPH